jgi:disulfide bond formation protein DsbB
VATGGGLATRTLYSDLDETTIDVCKPILLTGIDSPASRGDLLDRALVVTLPAIADEARGDERRLWSRYQAMRPALVGALLDAVACALRRQHEVVLQKRPRMADACSWVTAAEPALGWAAGRTAETWLGARQQASADLIASDPVAQAVLGLDLPWSGSAGTLLKVLTARVPDSTARAKGWPTSPRGLSGALRRLAPDLRRSGIEITDTPREAGTGRRGLAIVTTVTPSQPQQTRADFRDGRCDDVPQPSHSTVTEPAADSGRIPSVDVDCDGRDGRDGFAHPPSYAEVEVPRGRF